MQFSYENQNSSSFLVCELDENEELDTLGMGMLTNNQIPGILPVTFVQIDEKRYLRFNISSRISLSDLFSGSVNRTRLLNIFSSLCEAFSGTGDYLLDNSMFLLNSEYMYADVSTGKTKLVYLPVERDVEEPDITALIKEMMLSVSYDETENTGYIARLMNYLNSVGKVDLDELAGILQELKVDAFMEGSEPVPQKEIKPVYQQQIQQPVYQSPAQPAQPNVYQAPVQQPVYQPPIQQPVYQQPIQPIQQPVYQAPQQPYPIYQAPAQPAQPPQNAPEGTSGTTVLGRGAFKSLSSAPAMKADETKKPAAQEQPAVQETAKKKKGLFGFMKKNETQANTAAESAKTEEPEIYDKARTYDSNLAPKNYVRKQEFKADVNQQISPNFGAVPTPQTYQAQNYQAQPRVSNGTTALNVNKPGTGTTVLNGGAGGFAGGPGQYVPTLLLKRERTGQEMKITKSVFHIGSEYSYADFYIPDNSAISRSHADIIVRGNKYYVKDSNSLNHTYLNGEMLTSNVEYPLRSGDTIIMANEAFEFRVK